MKIELDRGRSPAYAQIVERIDAAISARELSPGDRLPPERQQVMIGNAPTWVDEMRDPGAWRTDLAALAAIPHPILLTYGDQSLPFLPMAVAKLAAVLPNVQTQVIAGAGHVPAGSHPAEYAAAIMAFAAADEAHHPGPG